MMVYTTNILAVPLVLLIWALDLYLFLAAARLLAGRFSGQKAAQLCSGLQPFTDPMPHAVERWIASRTRRSIPTWLPWGIVIVAAMFVRQSLAWVIVAALGGHA